MRHFSIYALAFLGLAILMTTGVQSRAGADPALEPAEFVIAPLGTIIEGRYAGGDVTKLRIDEIGDLSVTWTKLVGEGRQDTLRLICWMGCSPTRRPIELDRYREIWPLEVGKKAKFKRRRADGSKTWNHKLKVLRTETLETALGPIDTFVVEEKVRWSDRSHKSTYWFAPSLGWWVKVEWTVSNGNKGGWNITSITPPG